ncbi:Spc98 family-domain-containing protein [Cristinia sonorae]|uniref:Spc98 family-domain-containing protein n=1 Tax=Cristinia sonorae TaxID=1940300 RepID=A0A8K0UK96_9AGAR|nr:Spc98 family-domain-containing protein [Cristinia sonorae]
MQPSDSRNSTSARRPPSSMSTRPSSSASTRPSSSASLRPSSSASVRPSSSASSVRPSSGSSRPMSRATQRPTSKMPNRSATKQTLRLLPFYQDLVAQITSLTAETDPENFRVSVEFVSKNLDPTARPALSSDMDTIRKQIGGYVQKSRILSDDTFADALEHAYKRLEVRMSQLSNKLDETINASRFASHMQLLLLLSAPPKKSSLGFADEYMEHVRNPTPPTPGLNWKDILAEEPFEGQHWQGAYGLPPGSTVEHWESESEGSTPSLSALDDLDDLDDTISSLSSDDRLASPPSSPPLPPPAIERRDAARAAPEANLSHRDIVDALQARQYWRDEWKMDVSTERPLNVEDVSTFGPAFKRALGDNRGLRVDSIVRERYIHEHDAVREILMGLQGRRNLMISWTNIGDEPYSFIPATDAPAVLHLTRSALTSILKSFAHTATVIEQLRKFVSAIFTTSLHGRSQSVTPSVRLVRNQYRNTRTLEAFAESVDCQLRRFDSWCADREEHMCKAQAGIGPPLVVSFLSLEVAARNEFSDTFVVVRELLLQISQIATRSSDVLREFWTLPDLPQRISPSSLTATLLDSLLLKVIEYASMGDTVTARNLMSVFSDTAEPLWRMIGKWVGDGMPVHDLSGPDDSQLPIIDDEFFVEDNELPLLDPDFWSDGFVLRDAQNGQGEGDVTAAVPLFLRHGAAHILSAGKAVGLLRALGLDTVFERSCTNWPPFRSLLADGNPYDRVGGSTTSSISMSIDDFSRIVYDELIPSCKVAKERLTDVLVDDCHLWQHLTAMEDLLLMRRGDAVSNLIDVIFTRMDSPQPWTDFHFLNNAFRDIVEQGRTPWVDPSLVRISHRGKDKNIGRTVRAIEGLLIEYAVPFPLTYIFGSRTMQVYSSIFVFVLQIRRAKNALERILVRGALGNMPHSGDDLKVFYAMRSKLSWFVNALLNFVSTNVLHTQITAFHTAFRGVKSLDDMILLHTEHLGKLEGRCLLQPNTSALHRAVISILDMCLHFSDCFVAFAGDTTHDISRQSLLHMRRHRSKRQRRQRKNVIGFSQSLVPADPDSSSESEPDDDSTEVPETSFSLNVTATIDFAEESFHERLDKMSGELDALVRFIRRGVESLAGGTTEAAPAFGIFAFALEDWDR